MFRKVAKLESFQITPVMLEGLTLPEVMHLEELLHLDGLLDGRYGLHLWIFLAAALFAALGTKNCQEKAFVCNKRSLAATVGMLFWTIISLSGISTFLYFNF